MGAIVPKRRYTGPVWAGIPTLAKHCLGATIAPEQTQQPFEWPGVKMGEADQKRSGVPLRQAHQLPPLIST